MLAAGGLVLVLSLGYLLALFAVASWGDRRADAGRSVIGNSWIYTLSLAVYCTAWTFYGSVELAAGSGLAFLPVYLGPTIVCLLLTFLVHKILKIAKAYGITSIADFIAARYGKSSLLAGLVSVMAVVSLIPYIALQLKAVAASIAVITGLPGTQATTVAGIETALLVALVMASFAILFGTRHIDATEHHEGMVLAIAFESVVKLATFLLAGAIIVFTLFGGLGEIFARAREADLGRLLTITGPGYGYADWFLMSLLSGAAFLVLPRQFQVAVIENVDERHLQRASWLLPCYLLLINFFVLPIAVGGVLRLGAPDDMLVLDLAAETGRGWLVLLVFLGGLSAATAMIIVETVALSTMISNDLVMPVLLRWRSLGLTSKPDLTSLVLLVRRAGILLLLLLGYAFYQVVQSGYGLVSIGLIAFCGVAQFLPPIIAGIYFRQANFPGALAGLIGGFAVWLYTLIIPALAGPDSEIVREGLGGFALLRPQALFGLEGLQPVSHALVWSWAVNILSLILGALLGRQTNLERLQAMQFVEVYQEAGTTRLWRGEARVGELRALLSRFLGQSRADAVFLMGAPQSGRPPGDSDRADAALVQLAERQLARAIGTASARVMVASVVRGEVVGPQEVMEILDEASQIMEYSRQLEQKSRELEAATDELRRANDRLLQLDELKDDFIATVSHELRTPLTSIRSFSEILRDVPDLSPEERSQFLDVLVKESERLTRLINDILDLSKIEAGKMEWQVARFDLNEVVRDAMAASDGLFRERRVTLEARLAPGLPELDADRDRTQQVVINLLSNAAKFAPENTGHVIVQTRAAGAYLALSVADNGPGIPEEHLESVFEKFRQVGVTLTTKPKGTGLGLTISRYIVEHFGGRIWAERGANGGAVFSFRLPAVMAEARAAE
jgi:Na+/proline symporter/nitrogen-specific signal transduction histidine kinase